MELAECLSGLGGVRLVGLAHHFVDSAFDEGEDFDSEGGFSRVASDFGGAGTLDLNMFMRIIVRGRYRGLKQEGRIWRGLGCLLMVMTRRD